jgi:prepilin peptidase CpaA
LTPEHIALTSVLGVALATSVATDLLWRRILDAVTYPALALALGIRLFVEGWGSSEAGLLSGLIGVLIGAGIFALFAWRGRMGWGDVKLMGVVGAVFGYPLVMAALVFTSLVGALQAAITLIWHGAVFDTMAAFGRRLAERARLLPKAVEGARRHIPYGVAIALGSLWTMWWEHTRT